MAEIASAYVTLIPSAENFGKSTEAQVGPQVQSAGSRVGSVFGAAIKGSALGVVAAGGALLATALTKGFQRLQAIDQAKAKLEGLGHTAADVDKIMGSALKSVQGTAFGLGDAATVAASTVAAGVKPGRELTKTLKLVADAATIGGSSLSEMGAIFNKVAASNKVQGDVINQLNDQGIPIVQLLAKQLGITSAEVTALASKGKIDFATFSAAMQQGLGGAALKSGDTFSGALANVGASLSRIGAGLLGGIFPHLAPAFQGITQALAPLEGKAAAVGDAIGRVLGPALEQIGPFLSHIVSGLTSLDFSNLSTGEGTIGKIGNSLKKLGGAFASIDFGALFAGLGSGAADTVTVFAVAIGFLADHVDTLAKILPVLVVAYAAYKTAQAAANVLALAHVPLTAGQIVANLALARSNNALAAQMAVANGVETEGVLLRTRNTIATVASTTAAIAASVASKAMAAAQFLLNAALTANPIGIVVVAIAALVAGLIIAYRHSETFRAIVDGAFGFIAKFVPKVVGAVVNFVKAHWQLLVGIIGGPVALVAVLVAKHFGTVKAIVGAVATFVVNSAKKYAAFVGAVIGVIGNLIGEFAKFAAAVRQKVGNALDTLRGLPGKIKSAVGDLGGVLIRAGEQIIEGLIKGIGNKLGALGSKLGSVGGFIKDHKGPPAKDKVMLVPAGQMIMDGLIDGIESRQKKLGDALEKTGKNIGKKVKEQISKIRDQLSSVTSDFAGLVDPIASNFTQGLFDATDTGGLLGNLSTAKSNLTGLMAAFKTLIGEGLKPAFLYQLFQSGGAGLILDLAKQDKATALQAGSLFGDVQSLSNQLGTAVAGATDKGAALENQTARLEKKLDKLIDATKRVGREVTDGVNGAASSGRRRAA